MRLLSPTVGISPQPISHWLLLLPVLAVLIWSVNIIVTQLAVGVISPFGLSFYRWAFAFVVLTPVLGWRAWHERAEIRRVWPKLAVFGFLGMSMYQGLAYVAAHSTTATNMGVINALLPIATLFIVWWMLKEKPSRYAIFGSVLSLFGLLFLLGHGQPLSVFQAGVHLGDALMLLAIFLYALYGVLVRRWPLRLSLASSIYCQIGFGALFQLPIMLVLGFDPIRWSNIGLIAYSVLLPSIVAPFFWVRTIQLIGPNRTSVFLNLLPIFTALIAVIWLQEQWLYYHSIGLAVTVLGVLLAQYSPRQAVAAMDAAAPSPKP
ncbi:MAG: DMT family transporter [Pseudomonadota bacterium]|nr:DMT family transporter [Pseudomonadota bacterium]